MARQVLIVEDEPHIVESLAFVLGREGFAVSSVMDGESALEKLRRAPPDLMILDLMIPRLNGFEVLKAAKADATLRAIPVMVLTAKGQAHDRRLAEEIGSDGFMTKPFSNRELVEQVRRLIGEV
jgi:two-component system OmpR family response regulator